MNPRKVLFAKLAVARFQAFLRERGFDERSIKLASNNTGLSHAKEAFVRAGAKWLAGAAKSTGSWLKALPGQLAKGSHPKAQWEGAKAGLKEMGEAIKNPNKSWMSTAMVPLTGFGAYDAATRKREKGKGFFQDVGERAGDVFGSAAMMAPGAAGLASWVLPYSTIGGVAGKAVDKGISATRAVGRGLRKVVGGKGDTYASSKQKFMKKRPTPKRIQGKKYKVVSNY